MDSKQVRVSKKTKIDFERKRNEMKMSKQRKTHYREEGYVDGVGGD